MAIVCNSRDEFVTLLLSTIRLGDVNLLETCLWTVTNPNIYLNRIYEELQDQKCTLFMFACLNKYNDVVRMLLNSFQPDTEVLNNISLNIQDQTPKIYENVTVLWVAAAMNNFEIVKLLVEHGARVNHTTKTNSTPLRCACFHGNIAMVRYLIENGADIHISKIHNETNLLLSVFRKHLEIVDYLINELGCDINECDDKGCSSLYLAVECGSFELVQLLLNYGARNFPTACNHMSPIMLAAEKRRNDLVTIILPYCSLIEQIQAEELLGSAFACREHGICDLTKTYEHFYRALELRTINHLPKNLKETTHEIFNHRQECQTIEQLKELQSNENNMYIEALLIRERLLGPTHVRYRNSLLYRGAILTDTAQYDQGIAFLLYELELHRQWSIPIFSKQLRYFVKTFAYLAYRWPSISVQILCRVISVIIDELKHNTNEFDYNFYSLLFLITITSQILTKTSSNNNDYKIFYRLVYSIIQYRYVTHDNGSSLLHLSLSDRAFSSDNCINRICKYPCIRTVRTLLQCGADVNANNAVRNTPLHVFVSNSFSNNECIFQILCNAGAHLDFSNASNETPMDVVSNTNMKQLLKTKMNLRLKCLCARVIQKNNIPFHGKFANSLVTFVERH